MLQCLFHASLTPTTASPTNEQPQQESSHAGPTTDSGLLRVSSSSPLVSDAMKKINTDKVKGLVEKRCKSKLENSRKVDVFNENDLIERELELGVELAISNKKGHGPHGGQVENSKNGYYGDGKGEEGSLSIDSGSCRTRVRLGPARRDLLARVGRARVTGTPRMMHS